MIECMDVQTLEDEQKKLNQLLIEKSVLIDGKAMMPVSQLPYLITEDKYQRLARLCEGVASALEKLLRLYVDNPDVQKLFPMFEKMRPLSLVKPPYSKWMQIVRFDIAETEEGNFKLMETNGACPAGVVFTPLIKQAYQSLSAYSTLEKLYKIFPQPIDDTQFFVKNLIETYQEVKGKRDLPNMAFLSSYFHPLSSELDLFAQIAKDVGTCGAHVKVQDLKLKNKNVYFKDQRIDLAYQKFDSFNDEAGQVCFALYEHSLSEVDAYWKGIQNGNLVVANSFPSNFVAEDKKIMALLVDPSFQTLFTQEEKEAIQNLCLNTFCLSEKNPRDKEKKKIVKANKDKFVIKRSTDTRGRGVWLGNNCSQSEWDVLVDKTVDNSFIVQEFVTCLSSPVYNANLLPTETEMYTNLGVFVIKGKTAGMLCRSSTDRVTNIGSPGNIRGCLRPAYVIKSMNKR